MNAHVADPRRDVEALYRSLLARWNDRNAAGMAALFTEHGHTVGFDGSPADDRAGIEAHVGGVFAHHQTAAFVGKVRGVELISDSVALLRAVAGMVAPGQSELNPATNAVQSMVAVRGPDGWRIALFQNTPAAFHGRPEESERLTNELRQALRENGTVDKPADADRA